MLESLDAGFFHRWCMVSGGEEILHKYFRIKGSLITHNEIYKIHKGYSGPYTDGQQSCTKISSENGRYQEQGVDGSCKRNLELDHKIIGQLPIMKFTKFTNTDGQHSYTNISSKNGRYQEHGVDGIC